LQQEPGRFDDRAMELGIAVSGFGVPQASMGIARGDADGDLDEDLFITNLVQETNILYVREARGFRDGTLGSGLGPPSLDFTGFGTAFLDHDLDGDLDLVVVNGRVLRGPVWPGAAGLSAHWLPYAQPARLYENDGSGHFRTVPEEACGELCSQPAIGRGLAVGDVDDDGAPDLLVSTGDGRVRLYRNRGPRGAHWLSIRAVEPESGRDAYGALVEVDAGGRTRRRELTPVMSYLSSSDPRVLFGLGELDRVEEVRVVWVDGTRESFGSLDVDRTHELVRGTGRS
jgi:hypothetical protein